MNATLKGLTAGKLRWWIAGLLFLATVINYIDRQTLAVVAPTLTKELGISNTQYADILTAFLVPYTAMYVASGYLVDRWGTRRALTVFLVWWSVASMLHSFARGALSLGIFRFLLGLGESGNFMAAEKAISEWFPAKERAFANGLVNAAAATGAIITPPLVAWITLQFGWRAAFAVTGVFGLVWLIGWWKLYRIPQQHPLINDQERQWIEQDQPKHREIPRYAQLLKKRQIWGLLLARVFADPLWWFYLFWLPKYLSDARGFPLAKIGLIAWMPYLSADLGAVFGGWMSGRFVQRGVAAHAARLRIMFPAALIMPVGIAVAYVSSDWAIALICVATFAHMAWKTNLMTMTNDLFDCSIVASAAGLVGLGSGLAGAWSTPVVGRIVDHFSYEAVFWMFGFLHIIATLIVYFTTRDNGQPESSKTQTY
jgi:MFS transporter, ACS family, hexuronate transporter